MRVRVAVVLHAVAVEVGVGDGSVGDGGGQGEVGLGQEDPAAGGVLQPLHRAHVVVVAVGEHDGLQPEAQFAETAQELFRARAGIDKDGRAALPKQIAVGAQQAQLQDVHFHITSSAHPCRG